MPSNQAKDPIASYRLICGAITAMPLIYMVLAVAIKRAGVIPETGVGNFDPAATMPISLALVAAGTVASVASIAIKKLVLRTVDVQAQDAAARFKATLVSMAISESGAVIGLTLMLLTGDLLYGGLLCGLSFAVTCFHFPSRYWLEQGNAIV